MPDVPIWSRCSDIRISKCIHSDPIFSKINYLTVYLMIGRQGLSLAHQRIKLKEEKEKIF